MGFGVLFLLLLVTAGWWLHSRWSALRDAQAARRRSGNDVHHGSAPERRRQGRPEAGRAAAAERLLPDLARQVRRPSAAPVPSSMRTVSRVVICAA